RRRNPVLPVFPGNTRGPGQSETRNFRSKGQKGMTGFSRITATLLCLALPAGALAGTTGDLAAKAAATRSDTLYIAVNGETVLDWRPEGQRAETIETMSVMKSLVAIAIGRLLHDGALESLDTPVHTIYPEWKQGDKQKITVRHLMNHTSGLQNHRNTTVEIYPAPDIIK